MSINYPRPHDLEGAHYQIVRLREKLLINVFDVFSGGDLYASQMWIKEEDISKASRFNEGHVVRSYPRFPLVYWANLNNRIIFIVGDGHHRIADALVSGVPIMAEIDLELKDLTQDLIDNQRKAEIKYGVYGLFGIWRFEEFLNLYKEKIKELSK